MTTEVKPQEQKEKSNVEDTEFHVEDVAESDQATKPEIKPENRIPKLDIKKVEAIKQQNNKPVKKEKTEVVKKKLTSPSKLKELHDDKDVFSTLVKTEEELKRVHKMYEDAMTEKATLEKIVKHKDAELQRTTVEYETALNTIEKLKSLARKQDSEIQKLLKENKSLREVSLVAGLTNRKKESETDRSRINRTVLPEESLDRIIELENLVKIRDTTIASLESEIKTLKQTIEKKDKAIEKMDEKFKSMEWKQDRAYETECKNAELNVQIEKLNKEIKTLQRISKMKTDTIEKLNEQLDKYKELEEKSASLEKEGNRLTKEKQDIELELKIAKKAIEQKDKEIEKVVNNYDVIPLKALENDKRYLTSEIKKLQERKSTYLKTIAFQKRKIDRLTARLETLNAALKDTKLRKILNIPKTPTKIDDKTVDDEKEAEKIAQEELKDTNEPVPGALFETLQVYVDKLRKAVQEKDILITEKDSLIESLQKNINVLQRSKSSESKVTKRKIASLTERIEILERELDNNTKAFKSREKKLLQETYALKKQLKSAPLRKQRVEAINVKQ